MNAFKVEPLAAGHIEEYRGLSQLSDGRARTPISIGANWPNKTTKRE